MVIGGMVIDDGLVWPGPHPFIPSPERRGELKLPKMVNINSPSLFARCLDRRDGERGRVISPGITSKKHYRCF